MKIEINIKKKHVYLLTLVLTILTISVFSQGQAPNPGHEASSVYIQSLAKDLETAVSDGDFAEVEVDCVNRRSGVYDKDAIKWCPTAYPKLMHCSLADNQAPLESPTQVSQENSPTGDCQTNGECKANTIRTNMGGDDMLFEVSVKDDLITQGCWAYDDGHSHGDYRIEVVCCK